MSYLKKKKMKEYFGLRFSDTKEKKMSKLEMVYYQTSKILLCSKLCQITLYKVFFFLQLTAKVVHVKKQKQKKNGETKRVIRSKISCHNPPELV